MVFDAVDFWFWCNTGGGTSAGYIGYQIKSADGNTTIVSATIIQWVQTYQGGVVYHGTLSSQNINLLESLSPNTTYQLHYWAYIRDTDNRYLNNGGNNYVATFTTDGSVPVELSSFTAAVSKNVVNLEWATATEINNYGFEVEKSADKTNWNKIGLVSGNGNSNSVKHYSYSDKDNTTNGSVYYRLKQIDNNGGFEYSNVVEANINMPVKFELGQNYPNPFNPTTKINYSIPEASSVKLTIFNAIGQVVTVVNDGYKSAGSYTLEVDGSRFNSGVYFYKLEAGNNTQIRKMILVK